MNAGDFALVTGGPFAGTAGIVHETPATWRERVVIRCLDSRPWHPASGLIGVAGWDVAALPASHLEAALEAFMRGEGR